MNPRIDTTPARDTHEPGTRTSAMLGEWRGARDAARETSHLLTVARATRERGRLLQSALVTSHTTALVEILGDLHDKAAENAADAEYALAAALLESGPVVDGTDRYEGIDIGGMLRVYRTPIDFRADHDGGHAATGITDDVMEGDAD